MNEGSDTLINQLLILTFEFEWTILRRNYFDSYAFMFLNIFQLKHTIFFNAFQKQKKHKIDYKKL